MGSGAGWRRRQIWVESWQALFKPVAAGCAHAASPTLRIKDSLAASIAFRVRAGRLERRSGKQRPDRPLDPNTQMAFVLQMTRRISMS
jgi:hypothetical protein